MSTLDEILYCKLPRKEREKLASGDLELMGTWEVAEYLGIERSRVARWLDELAKGKHPIDPPTARLKSGPMWQLRQVRAKAEEMYRAAGTPNGPKGLDTWLERRRKAMRSARRKAAAAPAEQPSLAAA